MIEFSFFIDLYCNFRDIYLNNLFLWKDIIKRYLDISIFERE